MVMTRNGYPKNGSGDEVGSNGSPQKILALVTAKRIAVAIPIIRTPVENSLGILMSKSAAAQSAIPAAKKECFRLTPLPSPKV